MKPYVTCYMMQSLNGRIDCAMTELINGSEEYYEILNDLHFDATISGKTTAKMHYAKDDKYVSKDKTPAGKKEVYVAKGSDNYSVVVDTLGTLTWESSEIDGVPMIVALSEDTTAEYLDYLKKLGISYIVTGQGKIDLDDLLETLNKEFRVNALGIVGGGKINGAFLEAGLIDELGILVGPGIDGRTNQPNTFDGFNDDAKPINLKLKTYRIYDDGAVYLEYTVIK